MHALAGRSLLGAALVLAGVAGGGCDPGDRVASAPAAGAGVELVLDGSPVATIDVDGAAAWPRLDQVLPKGARAMRRWARLEATGAGDPLVVASPAVAHPTLVAALYPVDDGVGLGLFEPATLAARGAPRLRATGVRQVRITLAPRADGDPGQRGRVDGDVAAPRLTIAAGGAAATTLELAALPRRPAPGGDPTALGWSLVEVLGAAGRTATAGVRLVDAAGGQLALVAADLDPARAFGFFKVNRQGALRFKHLVVDDAGAWHARGDLRDVVRIELDAAAGAR
ncbi:MAG: hypothetical protein R2939_04835 [Kofleriaceae bacterium]